MHVNVHCRLINKRCSSAFNSQKDSASSVANMLRLLRIKSHRFFYDT